MDSVIDFYIKRSHQYDWQGIAGWWIQYNSMTPGAKYLPCWIIAAIFFW